MKLQEEIMDCLKRKSKEDHGYINPNFLIGITGLLEDYFQLEDDDVDRWVQDCYGQ
jgi:hypothetical protein